MVVAHPSLGDWISNTKWKDLIITKKKAKSPSKRALKKISDPEHLLSQQTWLIIKTLRRKKDNPDRYKVSIFCFNSSFNPLKATLELNCNELKISSYSTFSVMSWPNFAKSRIGCQKIQSKEYQALSGILKTQVRLHVSIPVAPAGIRLISCDTMFPLDPGSPRALQVKPRYFWFIPRDFYSHI